MVMPGLWDPVHLSQLADAGWTHDTSQASPPPGVFKWELRRENQHLAGGDLFGCEAQVPPVSRSAILENRVNMQRSARQSKVLVERISLQSSGCAIGIISNTKTLNVQSQPSISFPLPGLEKIPGMRLDLSSLSELPEAGISGISRYKRGTSTARGANVGM